MDDAALRQILERTRTIAVLGAHREPFRAAYFVPEYLYRVGYRILPVNPYLVGTTLFGEPVRPRLSDLEDPVDLVDVFRRSDALAEHVEDICSMRPRPVVAWFQLGVRNDAVASRLQDVGITVIQDRCTMADHRRLF